MKKFILLYTISLLFVGCNSRHDKDVTETSAVIVDVHIEDATPFSLKASKVFSLEVKESFPGMIHKMQVVNDTIYIMDSAKAPGLYAYNMDGCFLYVYENIGHGPEDFYRLSDFQISNDTIYLLDASGKKLLKLDKTGAFLSSNNLPYLVGSFALESDGSMWFDKGNSKIGDQSKLLYWKDGSFSSVLLIPEELENLTISPLNTLITYNETIHYLRPLENVIYECEKGEVEVVYSLDFGENWPKNEFYSQNKHIHPFSLFRKLSDSGYIIELNCLENEKYLHLNFSCNNSFYMFFYNKETTQQCLYGTLDKDRPLCLIDQKFYVAKETDDTYILVEYNIPI